MSVPPGTYHKFANASAEVEMRVEAWWEPGEEEREERFFRNLCGYLVDVTRGREGKSMMAAASVPQLALFAWEADMPICEPGECGVS